MPPMTRYKAQSQLTPMRGPTVAVRNMTSLLPRHSHSKRTGAGIGYAHDGAGEQPVIRRQSPLRAYGARKPGRARTRRWLVLQNAERRGAAGPAGRERQGRPAPLDAEDDRRPGVEARVRLEAWLRSAPARPGRLR